ncbi:hypothetical protein [Erythrobacter crassostreae]|uniref:DUF4142 domain-containing protein n=1 Tax=Erythrobacter crassostreae TaxID=2828328 RepID=A0A9X1F4W5_9SPHN|nr:hypothetical protein [Erythrobacter crassostrea]MBV7259558.1 hypothetical protein [Erythrobacter crassostrea]
MRHRYFKVLIAASAATFLSACAGSSDKYPSLAIRDFERTQGQFTPLQAEEPAPIRAVATSQDLNDLVARAETSHGRFTRSQTNATALVRLAAGKSIESDDRQRALVALADLTAMRSDTAIALADLDLLTAEAATTFAPKEDIELARSKVETIITAQNRALDVLWQRLSQ